VKTKSLPSLWMHQQACMIFAVVHEAGADGEALGCNMVMWANVKRVT